MEITKNKISSSLKGLKNGMSKQIKCKSIKTKNEYHFECLNDCLKFFGLKNKTFVTSRVKRKNNSYWKDEWMFAYENEDYNDYVFFHYDPSCRKGRKLILKSDKEILKFNSIAKALKYLELPKIKLIDGIIINGYTVIFS